MSAEPSRKRPRVKTTSGRSSTFVEGVKCFTTVGSANLWATYKSKKVEFGRSIPPGHFLSYGIHHRFGALGWSPLITLPHVCYPDLVRNFYCNLTSTGTGADLTLHSLVVGVPIQFSIAELATILDIPNEGPLRYMGPRDPIIFSDEEIDAMHLPLMDNYPQTWKIKEQHLKPIPRLLSRIVQHNVYPRGGEREKQRLFQTYLTFCLYTSTSINLPYLIMMHMVSHVGSRGKQVLPYGTLLTPIFEHFGVNFSIATPFRTPAEEKDYSPFTETTLRHMGLSLSLNGDEDPMSESESEPAPAMPTPPAAASTVDPPTDAADPTAQYAPLHPQYIEFMTEMRQAQRTQLEHNRSLLKNQRRLMRQHQHAMQHLEALVAHLQLPPIPAPDDDSTSSADAASSDEDR